MTTLDFVSPQRLIPGALALAYASLVLLALPQSWNWLIGIVIIVLAAVVIAGYFEYSLLALWPAFVGLFLVSTCIAALLVGLSDYGILPFTGSNLEFLVAAGIGCGFIGWGIDTNRKLMQA